MAKRPQQSTEDHAWFSSDRPIQSVAEDRLGRASFARSLADAVRRWKGRDSLVLSMHGPWGMGKSSIKNMVVEDLRRDHPRKVGVVDFNPWQFSTREKLAEAFFDQIGIALGRGTIASGKQRKRTLRHWKKYAAYVRGGHGLLDAFKKPLGIAMSLAAAFLVGDALFSLPNWSKWSGAALLGVAAVATFASGVLDSVVRVLEARVDFISGESLEDAKESLAKELQKLETPMLVVVDDVDRLPPDQLQELFQLIKVNADLPNLVYLLLFEREVVERHIEQVLKVTGRDYLEK